MSSKGGDSESGGDAVGPNNASGYRVAQERKARCINTTSVLLRLAVAPLCIIAMVVMATDKQTRRFIIPITPPIIISKTAKFTGTKALVCYVYLNGIVAGYLLLRALYSVITSSMGLRSSRFQLWLTFVLDQMMVYALLAAAAATTEVAYIAKRGSDATDWGEICSIFGKFCNRVGISVFVCFCGILGLAVITILSAHQLFSSSTTTKSIPRRRSGAKTATTPMTPKSYGRT